MDRIKQLHVADLDLLLIENPIDLLYLTGLSFSKGKFLAENGGGALYVDGRYYEKAKKEALCPVFLFEEKGFKKELGKAGKVGFDSSFTTYEDYRYLQTVYPEVEWIPVSSPLREARSTKDRHEIEALENAARLTIEGCKHAFSCLKQGVTELEIAFEFEMYCRKKGASGLSFESIVAFGENSAYPHYRAGKVKLKENEIVLMDVGAVVDQYHGDVTRVHFFGQPNPRLQFFERTVRRAHNAAMHEIRPGICVGDLDRVAKKILEDAGVENLFTHSLGHGIGLETHEFPLVRLDGKDKNALLKAGMVITVEPGLYEPGLGGVRWENMVLVTEDGHKKFFDPGD